jgi:hypothetical protein
MDISKLTEEELQVYRDRMLDLLIKHDLCDEKRIENVAAYAEAMIAAHWIKRVIITAGVMSGAITGFGALLIWFRTWWQG